MTACKVLVVEDSPTMRQLIVFALKRIRGLQYRRGQRWSGWVEKTYC